MGNRQIIGIGVDAALAAALALSSAGNELLTRGPLDSPPPTPKPLILTPRPTSTALTPRTSTPTPQMISATPGPCTIALHEWSATCKTAYVQPVTWTLTLGAITDRRVVTSSIFDATSRVVFTSALIGGASISVSPRWQPARSIGVVTLTGQISGANWITGTTLIGSGPPGAALMLRHYRWVTATSSYAVTFYTATVGANGLWVRVVPVVLTSQQDYWQVWHSAGGITHVNGILTRWLIFPVMRR